MCRAVINRRSSRAVYRQLADILRDMINAGQLHPGDQLPSADMLSRTYGVSMLTAGRALGVLRDEGMIDTEPGRQATVRLPQARELVRIQRGSRWFVRHPTSSDERRELGLGEAEMVVVVIYGAKTLRFPATQVEFTTS